MPSPRRRAALFNATARHLVEFDDIHRDSGLHPASPTIAAALAAAEISGAGMDGLLRAIVAGYEVGCRSGVAVQPSHDRCWHTTGTVDTFGAGAAISEDAGKWEKALEGLGQDHATITFKKHGGCGHIFAALDGLAVLREPTGFAPDDIEHIHVGGYGPTTEICDRPVAATEQEARFSLRYCAAALLLLGGVRIAAFAPERLCDPAIQAVMARVSVRLDPELADAYPKRRAARLRVTLRDGRVLERHQPTRKGDPGLPLGDAELSAKFLELAGPAIGEGAARDLLARLWQGEAVPGPLPVLPAG